MNDQFYVVDYFIAKSMDNAALSILTSGHQICAPDFQWGPGIREMYVLHYIKKGAGIYQVGDKIYRLKAGDAFLIYPDTLCRYQADREDPWEYYWVGFKGNTAKHLLSQTAFSPEAPHICCEEDLSFPIRRILECKGQEPRNQAEMTGHLYLLLSLLMHKEHPRENAKKYRKEYLMKIHEFITQNYSRQISVTDLSEALGLSKSHLHRIFMEETGESPIQYLSKYRIEQSLQLLQSTDMSIACIANAVGFGDQLYFSRVFSKQMGMSPSKYRKEKR